MYPHLGQQAVGATVELYFGTYSSAGANVAPSSAYASSDIRIYKDGGAVQRTSAAGITVTSPFDSLTGQHLVQIDLSENTDAGFYATGHRYAVMLVTSKTVDGVALESKCLALFTIGTTPTVQDIVDAVLNELTSAHTTSGTVGKAIGDTIARLSTTVTKTSSVQTDAGNSATQIKTSLTANATDHYKDCLVKITSGVLAEQVKKCTGSTGTTGVVLTFASGFTGTPADGVTIEIIND